MNKKNNKTNKQNRSQVCLRFFIHYYVLIMKRIVKNNLSYEDFYKLLNTNNVKDFLLVLKKLNNELISLKSIKVSPYLFEMCGFKYLGGIKGCDLFFSYGLVGDEVVVENFYKEFLPFINFNFEQYKNIALTMAKLDFDIYDKAKNTNDSYSKSMFFLCDGVVKLDI